jgi:hypothetical protein
VAEKAEGDTGWLFPVGDEAAELGYADMFADVLNAWDEGREPMETFYDGYVVNAILDSCYKSARSKSWEPVELEWRGNETQEKTPAAEMKERYARIKEERMPDGRLKLILKDRQTGEVIQKIEEEE